MHAAAVAAAARAPCEATVVIDATPCGGPRLEHAACIVVAAGLRLAAAAGDGQLHRQLHQAGGLEESRPHGADGFTAVAKPLPGIAL